ncbi:conserved hypothetical protein [Cyanobium sp. PCC 7001]|nr:conserved hypothetical protein [Cyanobium sp. PCC 7001]
MSPLFSCAGCGVQIERSLRLYMQQKGRVFCSTCIDRQEAERQDPGPHPGPQEPPSADADARHPSG